MTLPVRPERVLDKLQALERRLETLERTSRLVNASLTDGTVNIYDAAGTLRVYVGKLPSGLFGVRTYDAGGVQTGELSG